MLVSNDFVGFSGGLAGQSFWIERKTHALVAELCHGCFKYEKYQ
jgi:hypothetical protein